MNNTPEQPKSPLRAPSLRVTAALAAAMLAAGVAVGAAIGPAPSPSLANPSLPLLLETLARSAAERAANASAAAAHPASSAAARPARRRRRHRRRPLSAQEATGAGGPAPATEQSAPAATPKSRSKASTLPPITHVWLIELAGTSFEKAIAEAAAAPYIDTQAIPAGTLLSGWSGIDAGTFANDATLIPSTPPLADVPSVLDTIVQPPCPEGAAGAPCASEAGALSAADEFLKATVPTITSTAAFRESGLIVVTFASIGSATATGLPAGAATATLTAQPPAGALLISPFASVGARSSTTFDPTSPKQSLEKLLRR